HVTLQPGQSLKYSETTILWNGVPNVSHLNETAAKSVLAGKITTQYAFPDPGTYYIKGVSYIGDEGKTMESDPIKITIKEPVGDDLAVWNEIKGNKEIAFLMEDGSFDTGKDEEKQQLTDQVEQTFTKYPQSIYSGYLKTNLEKYKAHETQRNEFYKNMNVGQKPQ
ncbi:MAG: hypothetical protein ACRD43_07930, partial [Pyrinomonadaceae bacterium]